MTGKPVMSRYDESLSCSLSKAKPKATTTVKSNPHHRGHREKNEDTEETQKQNRFGRELTQMNANLKTKRRKSDENLLKKRGIPNPKAKANPYHRGHREKNEDREETQKQNRLAANQSQ